MKVSVIVPLYNKAPYVGRTLDSILRQTYANYQVLVVDDGSSDDGPSIVRNFGDRRIRLVQQANAGPAHARNRGLAEAQGEYVVFLDADDEWRPGFLARTVAALEAADAAVIGISTGYVQHPAGTSTRPLWVGRGIRDGLAGFSANTHPGFAVSLIAFMSPWNTLLRTESVRRFGGFCAHGRCLYAEDSFLWTKLLLNGSLLVDLEELVYYHNEASELAAHRRRARPVEPMLEHPQDLYDVCPAELRRLLDGILAVRAAKTALMLSYFGRWRQARELLGRFCPSDTWILPKVAMAYAASNPAGSAVGWACRKAI